MFNMPVQGGKLTSPFGYRDTVGLPKGAEAFHNGIDLAVPVGTPVGAVADGRVVDVGFNQYRGNYINIEHAGGYVSEYNHLDKVLFKKGDIVPRGGEIAKSGNTGASTGPHLDFKLKLNGKYINPEGYLKGGTVSSVGAISSSAVLEGIKGNWVFIIVGLLVVAVLTR